MVGASISGISFVSVPGMSLQSGMTYLQMCLGFILGYFAIAFVLLPVYYRLHLTTIYTYLRDRLGRRSYKTGASFFPSFQDDGCCRPFLCGLYHLAAICFRCLFHPVSSHGSGHGRTDPALHAQGGIKTLVWTDTFRTFCLLSALVLIIYQVMGHLHFSLTDAFQAIVSDERSRIFIFDDVANRQYFWKQFLSGVFVAVVMTGLDQDMMQKEPHLSHPARGPKGYVYLWLRFRSCQPSVSLFRCLACTTCAASGVLSCLRLPTTSSRCMLPQASWVFP